MPDTPKFPAFNITSALRSQLEFNRTAGSSDPLTGTGATFARNINVQQVSQNSDGSWNQVLSTEGSPVRPQSELTSEFDNRRNSTIESYEELASVYDSEMLDYSNQINQKKNDIITLVTTAVGAGCSFLPPTGPLSSGSTLTYVAGADDIGGVACGIGSTIKSDEIKVKVYSNITSYNATSPFDPRSTQTLSSSNLGAGYENEISNNTGSILSSSYKFISSEVSFHSGMLLLTPSEQTTCAGYGASILQLADELEILRNQRDEFLEQVNDLKELKTRAEIQRWGSRQGDESLQEYNQLLQNAITGLSEYVDNIVTEGLVVHYDAGQTYGIGASVQASTNINAVYQWNNLAGDGLYATPQTSLYQINLNTADGPSVDLNTYPTATNQYFNIASSFIGITVALVGGGESPRIGSGSTSYALESWFKVTNDVALGISSTTNGASIVGVSSIHGYGMQVYKPSGIRLSFGERGNGGLTNNNNLSLNTWYHVVATNDSVSGSKIYVNGVLDGSGSPIDITASVSNLQIGYNTVEIDQYFSGRVSIVRIYNKNLSQDEVLQNFNAHKARYGY